MRGDPGVLRWGEGGCLEGANVLLPPAAKRVGLINFSGLKRSSGQCDSTYCKQCGMK